MQHKPNLLIVDDDSVTADMISQALGREGYALTVVNSGAEAVRQGKDHRFDLVLTDLRMPEQDGVDARRHVPSRD